MSKVFGTAACLAWLLAAAVPAAAADAVPAGHVKTVSGTVSIVRGQTARPAHPGDPVYAVLPGRVDQLAHQVAGPRGRIHAQDAVRLLLHDEQAPVG